MKFKHAFNILIDNFSVTYKQLLYRLIIFVAAAAIGLGVLTPFIRDFINSEAFNSLLSNIKTFAWDILSGNTDKLELDIVRDNIKLAYDHLIHLFQTRISEIVITGLLLFVLLLVEKWFTGLGNYTTAVIINDKMSLRTNSPFFGTLISHFKEAALFNLIYVPVSVLYDMIIAAALIVTLFFMIQGIQFFFVSVFIFALIMVLAVALKMTFTCDWLPALIRGKMGQRMSIKYSFARKNKHTFNVFSNFVVLTILVLATNLLAIFFTFGVGVMLTLPASFVIIISFEMVNYYDREELRYFLDKNTIIKPDKENVLTREQFFKGNNDDDITNS